MKGTYRYSLLWGFVVCCGFSLWPFTGSAQAADSLSGQNETILATSSATSTTQRPDHMMIDGEVVPIEPVPFQYVEVIGGCNEDFEGRCVVARSGPGGEYPVIFHLRNHAVLKIDGQIKRKGIVWYRVVFDEWLRYPERVGTDWYIGADTVKVLAGVAEQEELIPNASASTSTGATTTKHIVVDLSEQTLRAYEGETLISNMIVSTGRMLSSTPIGTFTVYRKTPSRFMQGPLPDLVDQREYNLPGVPWNLYFTPDGSVIHGAYWHDEFGSKYSHGCVNLSTEDARSLYDWAELGMTVAVQD